MFGIPGGGGGKHIEVDRIRLPLSHEPGNRQTGSQIDRQVDRQRDR